MSWSTGNVFIPVYGRENSTEDPGPSACSDHKPQPRVVPQNEGRHRAQRLLAGADEIGRAGLQTVAVCMTRG